MRALEEKWEHKISTNQKLIIQYHMQLVYDIFGNDFLIYKQEFPHKFNIFVVHQNTLHIFQGMHNEIWYLTNKMGTYHFRKQTNVA